MVNFWTHAVTIFVTITSLTYIINKNSANLVPVPTIVDHTFEYTDWIHQYLSSNPIISWWLIVIHALLLDICFVSVTIYGWIESKYHFGYYAILVTILRYLCVNIFRIPRHESMVYYDPKFISISTDYNCVDDFFFSGHVGLPIIAASEFFRCG